MISVRMVDASLNVVGGGNRLPPPTATEPSRKVSNNPKHMSGGANYLPKFLPISFFRRVARFTGVSSHLALQ